MNGLFEFVTFILMSDEVDEVRAMTRDEFVDDGDFEEWVWHLAPSKEAAIAFHEPAMEAYESNPEGFTYYVHGESK